MQNARRGQVYASAFDGATSKRLMEDQPIALDELMTALEEMAQGRPVLLTGDGMTAYRSDLERMNKAGFLFANPAHVYLRPAAAAVLAAEQLDNAVSADALRPCYLRAPQAVRQQNLVEKARHE